MVWGIVSVGDVDITQADIVVGVGRGIKEKENIVKVQALADALGGVLACSRIAIKRLPDALDD